MHSAVAVVPNFVGEGMCVCVFVCGGRGGREGIRLKLDVHSHGDGNILGVDGQGVVGVFKIRQFSWTSLHSCDHTN